MTRPDKPIALCLAILVVQLVLASWEHGASLSLAVLAVPPVAAILFLHRHRPWTFLAALPVFLTWGAFAGLWFLAQLVPGAHSGRPISWAEWLRTAVIGITCALGCYVVLRSRPWERTWAAVMTFGAFVVLQVAAVWLSVVLARHKLW